MPIAKGDRAVVAATGDADGAAFLLSAVETIGKRVVRADVIELRGRLVIPRAPALPAIDGDDRPLIARERDDVGVVRIDPDVLIIISARCAAPAFPGFATVGRFPTDDARGINHVRVLRIEPDDRQIAPADAGTRSLIVSRDRPTLAAVIRAKKFRADSAT